MDERWLPVVGFEGLYEVSNLGNVRSLDREIQTLQRGEPVSQRWKGRTLKQQRQPDSPKPWLRHYWKVTLCREGKRYLFPVHQLVAAAFIGPCPPGQEVLHGARGSLDNSPTNLSYGTKAENAADKVRDGTTNRGERNGNAKLTTAEVAAIREAARSGTTNKALAEQYDVDYRSIWRIVVGLTRQHE